MNFVSREFQCFPRRFEGNKIHCSPRDQSLRLIPTFAVVLREKIRTCAGFNKISTNYISEESLINGVYDKSIN